MTYITRKPRKARYGKHMTKAIILLAVLACSACATHYEPEPEHDCDAASAPVDAGPSLPDPLPTFWACVITIPTARVGDAPDWSKLRAPCTYADPCAEVSAAVCGIVAPCDCACKPMVYPVLTDAGTLDPRCE